MKKYGDYIAKAESEEAWLRAKGKVLMLVEVPFMALGWVLSSLAWPNRNERKEK